MGCPPVVRVPSRRGECSCLELSKEDLRRLHRLWRICGLDIGLGGWSR
jgi:hypothetical protein